MNPYYNTLMDELNNISMKLDAHTRDMKVLEHKLNTVEFSLEKYYVTNEETMLKLFLAVENLEYVFNKHKVSSHIAKINLLGFSIIVFSFTVYCLLKNNFL